MYYNKSYKNPQTARVILQKKLNEIGMKLSDIEYEIKKVKNSGYHAVVKAGGMVGRMLGKEGIVVLN